MACYTVPQSPPPLSQVDSITAWPGGAFPLSSKIITGGRRTKRKNKKSKRKNKKSRRCWS